MASAGDQGHGGDPGQQILCRLFGIDATELSEPQKGLMEELKKAVEKGDAWERTAATLTFLKLVETKIIRAQLCESKLLDVFVRQLRRKDRALLAAYALATCLNYSDMKRSIEDNRDLPMHIVRMLKLDYFDDVVGQVEGFQILGDLMRHGNELLLLFWMTWLLI
ncbi:hypothetical protein EV363DRAFT_884823 [Boletus edulis]|nr:hypothetical protein EV363DRAFT_884823 [Boletus edulis]